VKLVYDPMKLSGVTTAIPGVVGVLQMVSELTHAISRACTGQLRRIQWCMNQGLGYVRMTHGSSERDTVYMLLTVRTDVTKRGRFLAWG
jgi:hypothetical protein